MKVLLLSDNKPGHYKQSLGIVERIPACETEWVTVRFRQKGRDNLLRGFMCLYGGLPLPAATIRALLRWCLTSETYEALLRVGAADIVLSTGSSVAAVNLLLGRLLGAKSVTCRRPSPLGVRHFDLAILPMLLWHTAPRKTNVCRTIGVPNPISPTALDAERQRLTSVLNLPACQRIGLLLGGTDRHETITRAAATQLSRICEAAATALNAQVLVTTSRRTPPEVAAVFASTLKHSEACPLFVEAGADSELEDPYQAILALSDLLIVTADSFSMVCEAASSGRSVIVLTLSERRRDPPPRYKVYAYLEEQGIVSGCQLDRLAEHIAAALASPVPNTPLRDTDTAVEAIQRLVNAN